MAKPKIQTPLTACTPITGEHQLSETKLCGKINVRGDINNQAFNQAIKSTLGVSPPKQANTFSTSEENSIFWLGPDEWLAHVPLDLVETRVAELRAAMAGQHVAITDVSDYYTVIEFAGPNTRAILASASPFNTQADQFKAGQCAQTRFGHASILLWPIDDTARYRIQVRWSYAQYVFDYLSESIKNIESIIAFQQGA